MLAARRCWLRRCVYGGGVRLLRTRHLARLERWVVQRRADTHGRERVVRYALIIYRTREGLRAKCACGQDLGASETWPDSQAKHREHTLTVHMNGSTT